MTRSKAAPLLILLVVFLLAAAGSAEAATQKKKSKPVRRSKPRPAPSLVWHVESLDGSFTDGLRSDDPINPASVVKVATTWWALERLGPDHRFETTFYARGRIDHTRGVLVGDLVVKGTGDPDFQTENAFLVSEALNQLGIKRVTGNLVVNDRFWTGWENGSAGVIPDPSRRSLTMGQRLRGALDAARWTGITRTTWREFAPRTGRTASRPPSVSIVGPARVDASGPVGSDTLLFVHKSQPLVETLKRFNAFSNNDIERVGAAIGTPADLETMLAERLGADAPVQLSTTSGLGENRLTPRQIVAMLRGFREKVESLGLRVESLLPISGCDPGTVTNTFPAFRTGVNAGALIAKTGTLTATDGGITSLAGFLRTSEGEFVFCVAAPNVAGRIRVARRTEERWLLDRLNRHGGARPQGCLDPLAWPGEGAEVVIAGRSAPAGTSASTAIAAAR